MRPHLRKLKAIEAFRFLRKETFLNYPFINTAGGRGVYY
jgi:hypothetical protein